MQRRDGAEGLVSSTVVRRFVHATLAATTVATLFLHSCCGVLGPVDIYSADGASKLEVPFGWEQTDGLYELSSLETYEVAKECYVAVVTESKEDYSLDLDQYTERVLGRIENTVDQGSFQASETTYLGIDGAKAAQVEVNATIGGNAFTYLVTTVEGEEHWHHLIGWATHTRYLTHNRSIRRVVASFRETGERADLAYLGIQPTDLTSEGEPLISDDGLVSLRPPVGWTQQDETEGHTTLQIACREVLLYFTVMSISKEELGDARTLTEVSEFTRVHLRDRAQESAESAPVDVEIGGLPAVQVQVDTVESGWRKVYLHTTVESDTHYHQLIGWTSRGRYAQFAGHIEAVTASFEVRTEE